jgi:magnesium transporter
MSPFKFPWKVGPSTAKEPQSTSDEKPYTPSEQTQISFFSSQLDSCLQASSIDDLKALYEPLCPLLEDGTYGGLWWLDVTAPSEDDIESLSRIFNLHPLTTEDIKTRETREKIELFGPYYFLSLRPPRQAETHDGVRTAPINVYAVVFRDGVLSFSLGSNPHAAHVRSRIKEHQSHLYLTSDWICYALMYVYSYFCSVLF